MAKSHISSRACGVSTLQAMKYYSYKPYTKSLNNNLVK